MNTDMSRRQFVGLAGSLATVLGLGLVGCGGGAGKGSIMVGIWLVPVIGKKLLRGMTVLENRDAKWADIFQNAMFIGMISAFLGYVFCDFSRLWTPGDYAATSGLVPVCVMAVSAAIMVVCGLLMKKLKWAWVNDYALPLSLVLGMASAIPLTAWLG